MEHKDPNELENEVARLKNSLAKKSGRSKI